MIPKIIHYIWLGSKIPFRVNKLINNNKTHTPDYLVKIWTEENLPNLNNFAEEAFNKKNWAFVSDYVRFVTLYNYGGIYLDTDQKLLKNIDELLKYSFFAGKNKEGTHIYTGIVGSVPKSKFIKKIKKEYDILKYSKKQSSPIVLTRCYKNFSKKSELKIFDFNYFYPVQAGEFTKKINENAFSTHLWDESWVNFVFLRRLLRWTGIMKIYHSVKRFWNE